MALSRSEKKAAAAAAKNVVVEEQEVVADGGVVVDGSEEANEAVTPPVVTEPEVKEEVVVEPEPEIKEEVVVEPEPLVPEVIPEPEIEEDTDEEDPLSVFTNSTDPLISSVAAVLNDFNTKMGPGKMIEPKLGAGHQHSLLLTIKDVLNKEDSKVFVKQFNVINQFVTFKIAEAFRPESIHRFDYAWNGTAAELKQYSIFMIMLTKLANTKTRKENIKNIDFDGMITELNLKSERAEENLRKYFLN